MYKYFIHNVDHGSLAKKESAPLQIRHAASTGLWCLVFRSEKSVASLKVLGAGRAITEAKMMLQGDEEDLGGQDTEGSERNLMREAVGRSLQNIEMFLDQS